MKKTSGLAVLACVLGVLLLHQRAGAQCTQIVDLHGTVLDSETSRPVQGVLVCVDEYCLPPSCTQSPIVCGLCAQTNASGEFQILRECTIGMSNPYARWFYLHFSKDGYIAKDINDGISAAPKSCSYPGQRDSLQVDFRDIHLTKSPSGILETQEWQMPRTFEVHQNYPNPFNLATTIAFTLPGPAQTNLVVYDLLGRVVHSADLGFRAAGTHAIQFAALDAAGRPLRSGVYFYRVTAGSYNDVRRMVVLK